MKKLNLVLTLFILIVTWFSITGQENKIVIKTGEGKDTISRYIYGHFAEHLGRCIYDGIWVGEDSDIPNTNGMRNDIIEALKEIKIPVLRWPGGCFADLYHWKDGIGPKEDRPTLINKFWGSVIEDNSFGTHEFLNLCEMLETEPYLAVNVGSGTVKEAYDWMEYVTSDKDTPMAQLRRKNGREEPWKVKFWGIGNENWGCGGNMDASYYTDLFKRYATFAWVDYKIASGGLNDDFNWTETIMKETQNYQHLIQGVSYHHYTVCHSWDKKGSAINFDESEWFSTIRKNIEMEENLVSHLKIMEKYDPDNKVALIADEWGNWFDQEPGVSMGVLYQQNTLRDAITTSIYLNIFNNHCDRVKMANIAQTVNVLQAMVLTQEEKMVKTPTFYVFKMYNVHYDALLLPSEVICESYKNDEEEVPSLSVSVSKDKDEIINITIANVDPKQAKLTIIQLANQENFEVISGKVITSAEMNALNDFDSEESVNIQKFDDYKMKNSGLSVTMPSKSVVHLAIKTK